MRDSAVVMSSTMPSAKYSCSGSPLMFWNGSTAIDGLSGSASAGRSGAPSRTRNTRIVAAMFFSSGAPRSSTSSASLPTASSRTRPEMQMPPAPPVVPGAPR